MRFDHEKIQGNVKLSWKSQRNSFEVNRRCGKHNASTQLAMWFKRLPRHNTQYKLFSNIILLNIE